MAANFSCSFACFFASMAANFSCSFASLAFCFSNSFCFANSSLLGFCLANSFCSFFSAKAFCFFCSAKSSLTIFSFLASSSFNFFNSRAACFSSSFCSFAFCFSNSFCFARASFSSADGDAFFGFFIGASREGVLYVTIIVSGTGFSTISFLGITSSASFTSWANRSSTSFLGSTTFAFDLDFLLFIVKILTASSTEKLYWIDNNSIAFITDLFILKITFGFGSGF